MSLFSPTYFILFYFILIFFFRHRIYLFLSSVASSIRWDGFHRFHFKILCLLLCCGECVCSARTLDVCMDAQCMHKCKIYHSQSTHKFHFNKIIMEKYMYINYSTVHATEYWHPEKMYPPLTDILNNFFWISSSKRNSKIPNFDGLGKCDGILSAEDVTLMERVWRVRFKKWFAIDSQP